MILKTEDLHWIHYVDIFGSSVNVLGLMYYEKSSMFMSK